jgi:TonB family protein
VPEWTGARTRQNKRIVVVRGLLTFALILGGLSAQDLEQGVAAYKNSKYPDAAEAFRRAVAADPNNINARLFLATALMTQYIPGSADPANDALGRDAEREFEGVLARDPANRTALSSLASLTYQQAQGAPDLESKKAKLEIAAGWYHKLLYVDPQNKEAYYSLGVIDWLNWYPAYQTARAALGMKPKDPGPIADYNTRQDLSRYSHIIEDGIQNLQQALAVDDKYDDAMAYMNLLIRERADIRDTQGEYQADMSTADAWLQKALETKKAKAEASAVQHPGVVAFGNAPPVQGNDQANFGSGTPQRIRVGGNVQAINLIRQVQPVYPALAKAARIQGTVRFTVIIDREGNVTNLQLVSGHPLLVEAAWQAVKQWTYKTTLLNGSPVEVVTLVDVNFTISE